MRNNLASVSQVILLVIQSDRRDLTLGSGCLSSINVLPATKNQTNNDVRIPKAGCVECWVIVWCSGHVEGVIY